MARCKKNVSSRTMDRAKGRLPKWFFIILFTSYVSGISLFTHTHVINNTTYVHSHPFKKGEKSRHTHTENQLFILDHFYNTSITSDILPKIDLSAICQPKTISYIDDYQASHLLKPASEIPARGPPSRVYV